jgi:hypothetical protein
MAARISDWAWSQARTLTLPPGAATAPGSQNAELESVTCTAPSRCTAVGSFRDPAGSDQPMVADGSPGHWQRPIELALPMDAYAAPGSQHAVLEAVSCPSAGGCVAVGYFTDGSGSAQPLAVTETAGVWGTPLQISLPANAASEPGSQSSALYSVACSGRGVCQAVGYYTDILGNEQSLTVGFSDGSWGQPQELPLPLGANPFAGGQASALYAIACSGPTTCEAIGSYTDLFDNAEPMGASERGGVWRAALKLSLPPGALGVSAYQHSYLFSIACPRGYCVAVGSYTDVDQSNEVMALRLGPRGWGRARELELPANATGAQERQNSLLGGVWCARDGRCAAVGSYTTKAGSEDAMVLRQRGTRWRRATELSLPGDAARTAQFAGLYSIVCTAASDCIAVGAYKTRSGSFEAMVAGVGYRTKRR